MLHVTHADYLGDFCIRVDFNDGFTGVVDLRGRLDGPVFRELNDVNRFREFSLVGHTLAWKNGADLAPEYLRGLADGRLAEHQVRMPVAGHPPHTTQHAGPAALVQRTGVRQRLHEDEQVLPRGFSDSRHPAKLPIVRHSDTTCDRLGNMPRSFAAIGLVDGHSPNRLGLVSAVEKLLSR